jgi:hypothetical protein
MEAFDEGFLVCHCICVAVPLTFFYFVLLFLKNGFNPPNKKQKQYPQVYGRPKQDPKI